MRCAAITRAGGRCRLDATHGSYCYQHAPETAEERRRNARKGGKVGGKGRPGISEIVAIKKELHAVIAGVLSGRVDKGRGAVAFQGYNALMKAHEIARRIHEQEDLEVRIEALERAQEREKGSRKWGT
jgi:hypothetical protein